MAERRHCPHCAVLLVGMEATRRVCQTCAPIQAARIAAEEAKLPKCADCGGPIYLLPDTGLCSSCRVKRELDDDDEARGSTEPESEME